MTNHRPERHLLQPKGRPLGAWAGQSGRVGGSETDAEELCGRRHGDIGDIRHIEAQVLKQKGIPFLLGEARVHRA